MSSKYSRKVELREAEQRRAANESNREQAAVRIAAVQQPHSSRLRSGAEAMPWHGREGRGLPGFQPAEAPAQMFTVRNTGPGGARVAIVPVSAKASDVVRFAQEQNTRQQRSGKYLIEIADNSKRGRCMELSSHDIHKMFGR